MLKVLIRSRVLRKLRRAICRALITRKGHLRGLRPRPGDTGGWPRRHGHPIFWPRSLGWNHLVRVVESRRGVPGHAIEHALELARILGCGRGMEEGGRRVNGRRIEGPIVLAREVGGVGEPGIHVVQFYQPIYDEKLVSHRTHLTGAPSSRGAKTIAISSPPSTGNGIGIAHGDPGPCERVWWGCLGYARPVATRSGGSLK